MKVFSARFALIVFITLLLGGCASSTKKFDDSSLLYLEEVEGDKALGWVRAQNERSLKRLEADPLYGTFFEEAKKILMAEDRIPYGSLRGGYVYNFWQDEKNVRGLWRRTPLASYHNPKAKWETILDLDKLSKDENENWVFKGTSCRAPKGNRCIVTLSRGGKDASVYREFDLSQKRFIKDGFILPEAKSGLAWQSDNDLLVATNWGEGSLTDSGYPRIVKHWRRGVPLAQATQILEISSKSMGVWPVTFTRPEASYSFLQHMVSFYEGEIYLVNDKLTAVKLPLPADVELKGVFRGQVILKLRSALKSPSGADKASFDAGDLVSFGLDEFLKSNKIEKFNTVFKQSGGLAIEDVGVSRDVVYVGYLDNVEGKIAELKWNGSKWESRPVPVQEKGSVDLISSDEFTHLSLVSYQSYTEPIKLFLLDSKLNSLRELRKLPPKFKSENLEVERFKAKSKDGVEVPYFVIRPKDIKFDGQAPTLLYGYGGFEISQTPSYLAVQGKLWMERGGVYVVANIRGGGEFGPAWHQAALKKNRQKAFDDFIAVAEDLIARKITSPARLGISGGSNGGLLVGATFTQRPELFNAAICAVPLLDMLRFHQLLAGASWKAEYGDPEKSDEREVLAGYSPFHQLDRQMTYPEVFFVTSTKDDRVHPGHARKMAAKMEIMGKPMLYYENIEGGHSASANLVQLAMRQALQMVYLNQKLAPKASSPEQTSDPTAK